MIRRFDLSLGQLDGVKLGDVIPDLSVFAEKGESSEPSSGYVQTSFPVSGIEIEVSDGRLVYLASVFGTTEVWGGDCQLRKGLFLEEVTEVLGVPVDEDAEDPEDVILLYRLGDRSVECEFDEARLLCRVNTFRVSG